MPALHEIKNDYAHMNFEKVITGKERVHNPVGRLEQPWYDYWQIGVVGEISEISLLDVEREIGYFNKNKSLWRRLWDYGSWDYYDLAIHLLEVRDGWIAIQDKELTVEKGVYSFLSMRNKFYKDSNYMKLKLLPEEVENLGALINGERSRIHIESSEINHLSALVRVYRHALF